MLCLGAATTQYCLWRASARLPAAGKPQVAAVPAAGGAASVRVSCPRGHQHLASMIHADEAPWGLIESFCPAFQEGRVCRPRRASLGVAVLSQLLQQLGTSVSDCKFLSVTAAAQRTPADHTCGRGGRRAGAGNRRSPQRWLAMAEACWPPHLCCPSPQP